MNAQFQKTGENMRFHRLNASAEVDESTWLGLGLGLGLGFGLVGCLRERRGGRAHREQAQGEDVRGEHARDAGEGAHVHERLRQCRLACEDAADTLAHLGDRANNRHVCAKGAKSRHLGANLLGAERGLTL